MTSIYFRQMLLLALVCGCQTEDTSNLQRELTGCARWDELFLGFGCEAERVSTVDGIQTRQTNIKFDQLGKNVWRIETAGEHETNGPYKHLTVSDEKFIFTALSADGRGFRYQKLGFEPSLHKELADTWKREFPPAALASRIAGSLVAEVLGASQIDIKQRLSIADYRQRRVERLEFVLPFSTGTGLQATSFANGSIEWLPDHGLLIRRALVKVGDQIIQDDVIEYDESAGRLLPNKVTSVRRNGRVDVTEIKHLRQAEPERGYYRAESLGLTTRIFSTASEPYGIGDGG